LVIVASSFPSYFFSASLHPGGIKPLCSSLDSFSKQRGFPRFAKIVRPKRKLPAAPASAGGISLLRLRNTPANANVRADFFQRKEKIEEFSGRG
jgi:hypothetical protein